MPEAKSGGKSVVKYFVFAAIFVLIDQATKLAVKGFSLFGIEHEGMRRGFGFEVIGDFFRITFVENDGFAGGHGLGKFQFMLSVISLVASAALSYFLFKIRDAAGIVKFSVALILAGAFGNLIDRMFYGVFYGYSSLCRGSVVDFFDVDIPDISFLPYNRWPVFNVADACVTVGVVLLLLFHKRIPPLEEVFAKTKDV